MKALSYRQGQQLVLLPLFEVSFMLFGTTHPQRQIRMPSAMEKSTATLHTFRIIMLQDGLAALQHDSQSVAKLPIKQFV